MAAAGTRVFSSIHAMTAPRSDARRGARGLLLFLVLSACQAGAPGEVADPPTGLDAGPRGGLDGAGAPVDRPPGADAGTGPPARDDAPLAEPRDGGAAQPERRDAAPNADARAPERRDASPQQETGPRAPDAAAGRDASAAPVAPTLVPAVMAVGTGGMRLLSLDEGATWTRVAEERANGGDDGALLRTVAYGNGVWVAAGVFKLMTSTDGRRWTERPRDHCFESITFGQGRFVGACGGEIYTSTDGIKWTPPKRLDFGGHCYVVYGDGQFVAYSAEDRRAFSSPDGITWTPLPGVPSAASCEGMIRTAAGCFNAAWGRGVYLRASGGGLARSPDGKTWTSVYRDDHGNSVFSNPPAQGIGFGYVPR
jgi:hypothetical protein